MKEYKFVKHHISPDDFVYRVYKRKWLFFWSHVSSHETIECCQSAVIQWRNEEIEIRNREMKTPSDKVEGYM